MTAKKTIGAVVLSTGLATATLTAGLATTATAANAGTATSVTVAVAQQAPAVTLQPWPVLRQGSNSAWPAVTVRSLQYLLDAHGAKVKVTGTFGAATKAAVLKFQRAHHLTADGVAGAKTWRALLVNLKLGSTGPAVRAVQDQANFRNGKDGHSLDVDGIYGKKTQAWVRAFQQAMAREIHGFPVDGRVGPATWQALVTEALSG